MKINIYFLEAKKDISVENKRLLKKTVLKHAKIAAKKLDVDLVNITVHSNRELTIPKVGIGGFAPSDEWIRLAVDPLRNSRNLANIIKNVIPLSIYHEMNHVSRWTRPGYGSKLKESIISEGLAIVFAENNWNVFSAPWGEYKKNEIKKYLEIFNKRDKKQDDNYDHSEWFFGKGKPNWIGYKLGAYTIRTIREKHPKITIEKLTNMKAEKIVKLSSLDI